MVDLLVSDRWPWAPALGFSALAENLRARAYLHQGLERATQQGNQNGVRREKVNKFSLQFLSQRKVSWPRKFLNKKFY